MTSRTEHRAMAVMALLIPLIAGWIYDRTIEARADAATAEYAAARAAQ